VNGRFRKDNENAIAAKAGGIMLLQEIFERVKMVNAQAKVKHGPWKGTTNLYQQEAIRAEYKEYQEAVFHGNVDGAHGEIAEAIDTINVLCRRIQFLTGEDDA
jgi:hypothetical protein